MSTRQLYLLHRCPFGHRAAFALREKNIPHDIVFFEQGKRPPELEALGPNAKSPTLFDENAKVFESAVVLEYLEDAFPDHPLMPKDAAARADVRMTITRIASDLQAKLGAVVREVLSPQKDPAKLEAARSAFIEHCAAWDRELEGKTFVSGDAFSLADITLYTIFPAIRSLAHVEIGQEHPHLKAWLDRIATRPGATVPAPTA